jgi:hypothetical protein
LQGQLNPLISASFLPAIQTAQAQNPALSILATQETRIGLSHRDAPAVDIWVALYSYLSMVLHQLNLKNFSLFELETWSPRTID